MLKKIIAISIVASFLSGLSGCCNDCGPNQTGGSVLGGVAGAIIGAQFGHGAGHVLGAAVGGLLGAMAGGAIGRQMDERDRELLCYTTQEVLEMQGNYPARTWYNTRNHHSGRVMVVRTYAKPERYLVCRDYVQTVVVDGQKQEMFGCACRDARNKRGRWIVQR